MPSKLLIVIDMQNDFITGALGSEDAQKIVQNVVDKVNSYNPERVVFTRDTHYGNYLMTQEGKKLPVPHCIKDTYGWEIIKELQDTKAYKLEREDTVPITLDKDNFGYNSWCLFFASNRIKASEIEIVGVCTDICVVSNALILKALLPELPITVDARCCAGVTPESHEAALKVLKMCQINVIGD
jgi:nicotinamidase-related amidase